MKLIDRVLGREARRYFEGDASGAAVLMQSFGSPDNERILPSWLNTTQAYANSGAVFGVLGARMSLFTQAEFKWQNKLDKSLFGNTDLEKLENPWPNGGTAELLARMEQDASLAGNSYTRDAGEHLERLRPDWVTIVSEIVRDKITDTEVRRVIGYWYDPPASEGRESTFYPVEEVAHWSPIPDPLASFRGMSWLTPVLREIHGDQALTDYKRAYLANAATPNMLIKYKQKLGRDKLDDLRDQIEARHGGVGNAFRTMVLDEGADHAVLGNTFEQMTFTGLQSAGENRIAVAGGVPAIVAGLKEGLDASTYANFDSAMRRFSDITMIPNWSGACKALSNLVIAPAGSKLWFDKSGIPALRQGEKESADTMTVLASAASTLITAGYTADSVNLALSARDFTLLKHSGLVSVQLQAPGIDTAGGAGGQSQKQRDVAETLQKLYLAVGTVITSDEARTLANHVGAGLSVPGPDLSNDGGQA